MVNRAVPPAPSTDIRSGQADTNRFAVRPQAASIILSWQSQEAYQFGLPREWPRGHLRSCLTSGFTLRFHDCDCCQSRRKQTRAAQNASDLVLSLGGGVRFLDSPGTGGVESAQQPDSEKFTACSLYSREKYCRDWSVSGAAARRVRLGINAALLGSRAQE